MQVDYVILSANGAEESNVEQKFVLHRYAKFWKEFHPEASVSVASTVYKALAQAQLIGIENRVMQTFITGSLRLVGAALDQLEQTTPREGCLHLP